MMSCVTLLGAAPARLLPGATARWRRLLGQPPRRAAAKGSPQPDSPRRRAAPAPLPAPARAAALGGGGGGGGGGGPGRRFLLLLLLLPPSLRARPPGSTCAAKKVVVVGGGGGEGGAAMERWKARVALVTGASVGIGAAVARALVQQGMKVVGCARSVDKIEKLAAECQSAGFPGTLIPYKCDLSVEEEILSMFSAIKTLHQGVDVCINNAGLARPEPLLSGKTEGWRTMLDVNVMAVSICTREAYQSMKERNIDDGHIININSMNGHSVVPQSVVHFYSATKYAVTALTEGLRQELREAKTHIRATCISPGLVETGFAFKLHDSDPERAAATYESIRCLKAEDMANAVLYVLSAPPHVQIGDIQMRPTEQLS